MSAVAVVLALVSGCGRGTPEPRTPEAARGEMPRAPVVATTPTGQQYAIADAPTAPSAAPRPEMSAAARQAHDAGLQAFQAGDLAGARAQFKQAIEADTNAYASRYSLAVVEERLGNVGAALSSYRAALLIVRDYEPAIVGYAMLSASKDGPGAAETFLNEQRSRFPDSAAVIATLAEIRSILKDSASAQRLAQEALKKNPDYRPAMITLGRDHYRNRRLDLALYTLTAILDGYGAENPPRDKNNASAWLLRGIIYREQGRRKDAIANFKKAMELRPDLVEARVNLATYMLEAGNAVEGAPVLEDALRYDAANVLAHLNLGDAYRLLGKAADAQRHLEWVIAKQPTLPQARYNLGLLYLFSPEVPGYSPKQAIDKAIAEFERFKTMQPRGRPGAGDDVDELLTRARNKKAIMEAMAAEAAHPPPGDPGARPAAPAGGGSTGALPPVEGGGR